MPYVKCPCQHCASNIEFDSNNFVRGTVVQCPACKDMTVLFVRKKKLTSFRIWMAISVIAVVIWAMSEVQGITSDLPKGWEFQKVLPQLFNDFLSFAGYALWTVLYFLPYIVARRKRKRDADAIGVVNLLLGWSVIGWIVALIWACTVDA